MSGAAAPAEPVAADVLLRRIERLIGWLARLGANRKAFWGTVLAAALLPWLAPRLPMVDLPQHAGQVALWRDLLLGASPWSPLLRINLATPYLAGYGLALPLTWVMPAGTALTLLLSAAHAAFVAAAVGLRREVGADPRLDWLLITPFYGFAWAWGFLTFLIVSPLVLVLARIAWRHGQSPTLSTHAALTGLGLVLLVSHGLAFVLACVLAGAIVLAWARSVRGFAKASIPFVVLALVCVAFFLASKAFGTSSAAGGLHITYGIGPVLRVLLTFTYGHGFSGDLMPLTMGLLLVPFVLGLKLDWRATVPFAVVAVVMLTVPQWALQMIFVVERFGMFALPAFVLMFAAPTAGAAARDGLREHAVVALMVAASWCGIALMAHRLTAFAHEAADFEVVLAAAEPGKRAMSIALEPASKAAAHPYSYLHMATWYQAEKRGLVDFNFAIFHPQVVRFRPGHVPAAGLGFDLEPEKLDWQRHNARLYDYYFVRHGGRPLPARIVANGECRIETVAAAGAWTLLKRGACDGQDG